eukprot:1873354-Rhodomonas_salina.3
MRATGKEQQFTVVELCSERRADGGLAGDGSRLATWLETTRSGSHDSRSAANGGGRRCAPGLAGGLGWSLLRCARLLLCVRVCLSVCSKSHPCAARRQEL